MISANMLLPDDARLTQMRQAMAHKTLEAQLKAHEARVVAHEQAHLSQLGPIGGQMQLTYRTVNGIRFAASGAVHFQMPQFSYGDPVRSKQLFEHVYRGAIAPGLAEMSNADRNVAQSALANIRLADQVIANPTLRFGKQRGPRLDIQA